MERLLVKMIHKPSHTGEKALKCMFCEKALSYSSHLSRHRLSHTGERPFKCMYCEKAFSNSSYLTTHIRNHTGEKSFKVCPVKRHFVGILK